MTDELNLPVSHRVIHIVSQHRRTCCECGGHIEKLDVYQHVSGHWENARGNKLFRTCGRCDEIRDWLLNETDWPGIRNVPGTFIFRRLRQHLLDLSRTGDRAFRIPALRRVVEMNRRRTAAKAAT